MDTPTGQGAITAYTAFKPTDHIETGTFRIVAVSHDAGRTILVTDDRSGQRIFVGPPDRNRLQPGKDLCLDGAYRIIIEDTLDSDNPIVRIVSTRKDDSAIAVYHGDRFRMYVESGPIGIDFDDDIRPAVIQCRERSLPLVVWENANGMFILQETTLIRKAC